MGNYTADISLCPFNTVSISEFSNIMNNEIDLHLNLFYSLIKVDSYTHIYIADHIVQ